MTTNPPPGAAVPQDAKPVNTNDLRDYADEISNPYAQLILDAAHQLDVARTDRNILDGLVSDLCARLKATTALVEKLESEAYQLRAALTPPAEPTFREIHPSEITFGPCTAPPADDEIEAAKYRHKLDEHLTDAMDRWHQTAHTDRATLLRAVDRLSAELAKERERRVEVERSSAERFTFLANAMECDGYDLASVARSYAIQHEDIP